MIEWLRLLSGRYELQIEGWSPATPHGDIVLRTKIIVGCDVLINGRKACVSHSFIRTRAVWVDNGRAVPWWVRASIAYMLDTVRLGPTDGN